MIILVFIQVQVRQHQQVVVLILGVSSKVILVLKEKQVLKDRKGTTLRQYIIAYRLKLAKKLLTESAKSVNEVSEECGFNDPSYFTKTFKAAFGMTPKEYRNLSKDYFI